MDYYKKMEKENEMRNVAKIKYLIESNKEALKMAPKNTVFYQMIEDSISRLEAELGVTMVYNSL